jgi:hypothetical protein
MDDLQNIGGMRPGCSVIKVKLRTLAMIWPQHLSSPYIGDANNVMSFDTFSKLDLCIERVCVLKLSELWC